MTGMTAEQLIDVHTCARTCRRKEEARHTRHSARKTATRKPSRAGLYHNTVCSRKMIEIGLGLEPDRSARPFPLTERESPCRLRT
jgi:hypothetical protein